VFGSLLLCLVALGLVLMHHAPADHHMGAMSSPKMVSVASATGTAPVISDGSDGPGPGGSHMLMHLCLAVIGVFGAVAALGWVLLGLPRRVVTGSRSPTRLALSRIDRPPGGAGRTVLTSLCVLRL